MNSATKQVRVMLIGAGPHAQKVYIPWLVKHGLKHNAIIRVVIELKSQATETKQIFDKYNLKPDMLFIEPLFDDKIGVKLKEQLDNLVLEHRIGAVIIATEPSTHKPFGIWALENGLDILMDKPVSTEPNASNNPDAARQILKDYEELNTAYKEKKLQNANLVFSINVQRRYHHGFSLVMEKIKEVARKTNCPITSIQSSHGDGQWRTPDEVIDITYHGFTNGYGKASHSGYHFFDIIGQFLKVGTPPQKRPDTMEVFTTLSKPADYIRQFNLEDYRHAFKDKYTPKYSLEEFLKITKNFGEIDSHSLIRFLQDEATITTVNLSLLHNSLSQRSWVQAREDLYKGNGRVKHEYHCLQQGPFQSIQIHSYQSKSEHENNTEDDYAVGGNNHFDVYVFRNEKMVGGKRFEKFSISQFLGSNTSELLTTITKGDVLAEFFNHIHGTRISPLRSDLSDQWLGVSLMSSVYLAGAEHGVIKRGVSYDGQS